MVLAHCNEVYRTYTQTLPRDCHLFAYVDDIALQIVAPAATIARIASEAACALQRTLISDLQCVINNDKNCS